METPRPKLLKRVNETVTPPPPRERAGCWKVALSERTSGTASADACRLHAEEEVQARET